MNKNLKKYKKALDNISVDDELKEKTLKKLRSLENLVKEKMTNAVNANTFMPVEVDVKRMLYHMVEIWQQEILGVIKKWKKNFLRKAIIHARSKIDKIK